MSLSKVTMFVMGGLAIGLVSGAATSAQAPSKDVISKLDNNQGIFVDKQSFDVVKGNAKTDNPVANFHENGRSGSVGRRDHLPLRRKALHRGWHAPRRCFAPGHEGLPVQLEC